MKLEALVFNQDYFKGESGIDSISSIQGVDVPDHYGDLIESLNFRTGCFARIIDFFFYTKVILGVFLSNITEPTLS